MYIAEYCVTVAGKRRWHWIRAEGCRNDRAYATTFKTTQAAEEHVFSLSLPGLREVKIYTINGLPRRHLHWVK